MTVPPNRLNPWFSIQFILFITYSMILFILFIAYSLILFIPFITYSMILLILFITYHMILFIPFITYSMILLILFITYHLILFIPFITYSMILFITLLVPLSAGYSSAAPAASINVKVATTNRRMGIYWPYIRPKIEKELRKWNRCRFHMS